MGKGARQMHRGHIPIGVTFNQSQTHFSHAISYFLLSSLPLVWLGSEVEAPKCHQQGCAQLLKNLDENRLSL